MSTLVAGERFDFRAREGVPANDAWRALDHAVARWVIAHGGSVLLAESAAWASLAEGQGDSALPLHGPGAGRHGSPVLDAAQLAQLKSQAMVGDGEEAEGNATPFVLDDDHFYLRRNYLHEVSVAALVRERREARRAEASTVSDDELDQLFQGARGEDVAAQRDAVRQVGGSRLFVLTGGPGTGKTTTVLRMLLALSRVHLASHGALPAIRIGAPTGKAAARLSESLRQGAEAFACDPRTDKGDWSCELANALGAESGTLHRLLGSRGRHGGFRHNAGNPLPADIVVVDEASMVDLDMLRMLLEAMPPHALLLLVGDADQLTSVGTGSVLLDLASAIESQQADDLVRLRHCFRADTALVPINEALRLGDQAGFESAWSAAGAQRAALSPVSTRPELGRLLGRWSSDLQAVLQQAGALDSIDDHDETAIIAALRALRERQLLCALREGEFGAEHCSDLIETALRKRSGVDDDQTWYPGRAVMITRNDYSTDLFNGDVGICLRHADGSLRVWFEPNTSAPGSDQSPGTVVRGFAPGSLPVHQGAFAVTVHKSQGSEYSRVAVLLPPDPENAVLSRQLLYTAITRAREGFALWSAPEPLAKAIATSVERSAALRRRLMTEIAP